MEEFPSWLPLNDVAVDDDIYTRVNKSPTTVDDYVEKIKIGDVFPPIEVQKIKINDEVKTIILDGYHRTEAYKQYNKIEKIDKFTEIEVVYWKKEILEKEKNIIPLILRAAEANRNHGLRLSKGDAKSKLIQIAELDDELEVIWKDVAPKFGVTSDWVSECVKDIIAGKRASRDSKIVKMALEGWTQLEIGEAFGIHRSVVSRIVQESELSDLCTKLRAQGKTPEDISRNLRLDSALTWTFLLNGRSDLERFDLFIENEDGAKRKPKVFNVWNFPKLDKRLGIKHEMNIPGQIALNLLYYFTESNDLVVDPMAGGGSTIDACLVLGRRCRAYDKDPQRFDILKRDILDGYDKRAENCDLIFLDPPYGDMVSYKNGEDFFDFMKIVAENSYNCVKKNGIVSLIMCDRTKGEFTPLIDENYIIFKNIGFECVSRISTPLTAQSANGDEVNKAREKRKLLGRDRVLFVFRRPP